MYENEGHNKNHDLAVPPMFLVRCKTHTRGRRFDPSASRCFLDEEFRRGSSVCGLQLRCANVFVTIIFGKCHIHEAPTTTDVGLVGRIGKRHFPLQKTWQAYPMYRSTVRCVRCIGIIVTPAEPKTVPKFQNATLLRVCGICTLPLSCTKNFEFRMPKRLTHDATSANILNLWTWTTHSACHITFSTSAFVRFCAGTEKAMRGTKNNNILVY